MNEHAKNIVPGSCHCGNIHYEFHWTRGMASIPIRACSCSFCMKHGAAYTSDPAGSLNVTVEDQQQIRQYRFGHGTAEFLVCTQCGVIICALCVMQGGTYAVINVNSFDNIETYNFDRTITDFEGESVDSRLDRRRRNWTPRVTIDYVADNLNAN